MTFYLIINIFGFVVLYYIIIINLLYYKAPHQEMNFNKKLYCFQGMGYLLNKVVSDIFLCTII